MPEPPPRCITYDQLVELLYPRLPAELRPGVDEAATGDLAEVSTIRRMLGTIEHQVAPTAFSVQLAGEDAVRCMVGGIELFFDAADAAVTPGLLSGAYELHLSAPSSALPAGDDGDRRRSQPRLLLAVGLSLVGHPAGSSPWSRTPRIAGSSCRR